MVSSSSGLSVNQNEALYVSREVAYLLQLLFRDLVSNFILLARLWIVEFKTVVLQYQKGVFQFFVRKEGKLDQVITVGTC